MSVCIFNFEESISKIQGPLYGFIFSLHPNRSDTQDILQKTNTILCEKQSDYDESKSFKGWVFAIARYQVMAHKTFHKRSKIFLSNEITETLAEDSYEYFHSIDWALKKKALDICYKKLPDHMQSIAYLRFKKNLSLKCISNQLNRPIGSISATLHRIRKNLTKCILPVYGDLVKKSNT